MYKHFIFPTSYIYTLKHLTNIKLYRLEDYNKILLRNKILLLDNKQLIKKLFIIKGVYLK
jgi:hypothetical protein